MTFVEQADNRTLSAQGEHNNAVIFTHIKGELARQAMGNSTAYFSASQELSWHRRGLWFVGDIFCIFPKRSDRG